VGDGFFLSLNRENRVIQILMVMKAKGQKMAGLRKPVFEPIHNPPIRIN